MGFGIRTPEVSAETVFVAVCTADGVNEVRAVFLLALNVPRLEVELEALPAEPVALSETTTTVVTVEVLVEVVVLVVSFAEEEDSLVLVFEELTLVDLLLVFALELTFLDEVLVGLVEVLIFLEEVVFDLVEVVLFIDEEVRDAASRASPAVLLVAGLVLNLLGEAELALLKLVVTLREEALDVCDAVEALVELVDV